MPIRKILQFKERHAPKGSFRANVLTFMTGTAIAQTITVAVSPVLTRLFSPTDFGVYGVYMSLVSIMAAVATLRYDQALMLPREDKDAASLFWASLFSTLGISVLCLMVCGVFRNSIAAALKAPELGGALLFLSLSIFQIGVYQSLNSWSTRQKRFSRASFSQVARSVTASGGQAFSGVLRAGPCGLIGASIFGDFFASLVMAFQVKRDDTAVLRQGLRWNSIRKLSLQYYDFPLYSGVQNLLNVISLNLPALFLAKFFGPVVAGFYALGVRILQLPLSLISTSLRQVLFQKMSYVYNAKGDTYALFKKATLSLMAVVSVPAVVVILFGPFIFRFLLGQEWSMAGEYARWLILWLSVSFSNLPAVLFFQVYRKQRILLLQDVFLLGSRIAIFVIGGLWLGPLKTLIGYSLIGVGFNAFLISYMWLFLRHSHPQRVSLEQGEVECIESR